MACPTINRPNPTYGPREKYCSKTHILPKRPNTMPTEAEIVDNLFAYIKINQIFFDFYVNTGPELGIALEDKGPVTVLSYNEEVVEELKKTHLQDIRAISLSSYSKLIGLSRFYPILDSNPLSIRIKSNSSSTRPSQSFASASNRSFSITSFSS